MNRAATHLFRRNLLGHVPRRTKAYTDEIKGSMNDLPQPCGNWKTNMAAKQRKNNAHLFIGLGVMAVTIIYGEAAGLFYMNATVPDMPADKNDYSR